ncbi:MAG: EamA family transporter [Brachymonas sp.]|nr:EamA family transporter [Brachymonas sp.]
MQALWMALGALFFSIMGVCIKLASPHYGTMEILFYRGLTGILIFSVLMRVQRVPLATPVLGLHIKRSFLGVTAMALWFYGIAHLPFTVAMMLNHMSSVWMGVILIGLGWWHSRCLLYPKLMGAVLLGFAGVVMLLNPSFAGAQPMRLPVVPALLALLAGLLAALAYMQVQSLGQAGEPEQRTVFYVSIGTTLLGLVGTLALHSGFTWPEARTVWLLPAVGLFASLGQWCLTRAYTRGAALVVASLQYLGLAFSSLFGVFLFHEHLAWTGWLGMALIIVAGIAATAWRPKGIKPVQVPSPSSSSEPCRTAP